MTARKSGPIPPDYHLSVSQFKLFYACPRKYWYQYVMGIPSPPNASQALGSATHKVLERYLTMPDWMFDWEEDKAHRVAAPGIEFLPKPGTVEVEAKISVQIGGLELVGYVDWYDWSDSLLDIGDHKTSKDPGKWGLGKEERKVGSITIPSLVHDLQMNVYAVALQKQLAIKADKVILRHVTYRTVGIPYAIPTTVFADLNYARMTWSKLEETVPRIVALRKVTDSARVPTVPATCGAFGGCPYQHICDGSPKFKQNKQLARLLKPAGTTPLATVAKLRGSQMSTAAEVKARLLAKLNIVGKTEPAAPKPKAPVRAKAAESTADYTAPITIDPTELLATLDAMGGSLPLAAVIPFVDKRYAVTWENEAHAIESLKASGVKVYMEDGELKVTARDELPPVEDEQVQAADVVKQKATAAKTPDASDQMLLDALTTAVAAADGRLPIDQGFQACKEAWPGARFHNSRFNKVLEMASNLGLVSHDEDYISSGATTPDVAVEPDEPTALPAEPTDAAEHRESAEATEQLVDPEHYAHQEGTPVNTPVGLDCTILLGCVGHHSVTGPTGAVNLDHWLTPAANAVEKRDGMHWISDEFGKGRKAIASQVLADLRSGTMRLPAILYVPRNHPAWPELSVIFAALPVLVIRPC